ncbi:MAG: RluA family pseudouridine synthase, partial [Paludibacteraceae bacterium]|nr:RluA family pseudouridine synthase [Paludibacteraceae bacterium]
GRTHQIRVHLSCKEGADAPIVGDRLYGSKSIVCRLMLHAEKITFEHPSTKKEMTFEDKAPFGL